MVQAIDDRVGSGGSSVFQEFREHGVNHVPGMSGEVGAYDCQERYMIPQVHSSRIEVGYNLATGNSYHSLMYGFRVTHNTIILIVRDVCQVIRYL